MYDSEMVTVDLRCDNSLMKTIIDRFGEDVKEQYQQMIVQANEKLKFS